MLDGTHFFECSCYSDEHTLKFCVDKENNELFTSIFLHQYRPFWKRVWVAIKYVFGYNCKYGHWDSWLLRAQDVERLKKVLDKIDTNKFPMNVESNNK